MPERRRQGLLCGSGVKKSTYNARDVRDTGSIPGSGIPLRRKGQPTTVFLPEESHGQRSLAGYSPWGCKELDITERLSMSTREMGIHRSAVEMKVF